MKPQWAVPEEPAPNLLLTGLAAYSAALLVLGFALAFGVGAHTALALTSTVAVLLFLGAFAVLHDVGSSRLRNTIVAILLTLLRAWGPWKRSVVLIAIPAAGIWLVVCGQRQLADWAPLGPVAVFFLLSPFYSAGLLSALFPLRAAIADGFLTARMSLVLLTPFYVASLLLAHERGVSAALLLGAHLLATGAMALGFAAARVRSQALARAVWSGDTALATVLLRAGVLLKRVPKPEATEYAARVALRCHQFQKVLALTAAVAEEPTATDGQRTFDMLRLRADAYLGLGDGEMAIALLGRHLQADPHNATLLNGLAFAHWVEGNQSLAISVAEEAIACAGGRSLAIARNNLAYYLCDRALATYAAGSQCSREAKQHLEYAGALVRDALRSRPDESVVGPLHDTAGMIAMMRGDMDAARHSFFLALEYRRPSVVATIHLGLACMVGTRSYRRAEVLFRLALEELDQLKGWARFREVVQNQLAKIERARAAGQVFDHRVVLAAYSLDLPHPTRLTQQEVLRLEVFRSGLWRVGHLVRTAASAAIFTPWK